MKYLIVLGVFLTSVAASTAHAQRNDEQKPALSAVANVDKIEAVIEVRGERLRVAGRASMHLNASLEALEKGQLTLGALNLALFDVPQRPLTYADADMKEKGLMGFVLSNEQTLRYDPRSGNFEGEVSGLLSADYMRGFAEPIGDSAERDNTRAPKRKASLLIRGKLAKPLELKESEKARKVEASMTLELRADDDQFVAGHRLRLATEIQLQLEYVIWWHLEIAQRLCVQPVRFGKFIWTWPNNLSVQYTGDGLAFGRPKADEQWAKADVVFTWRDWKTVFNASLFNFSTSEWQQVYDSVDDDDCVEIFFVEGDDGMHNSWGGGAAFYSGESYTKIISSDGNADLGIDVNHLAHELGHAMDLPHPNAWNSSSTGTLMCPSGFANDNPDVNSQENADNLSNPLLTFALKFVSPGPDCNDSTDCGACPAI